MLTVFSSSLLSDMTFSNRWYADGFARIFIECICSTLICADALHLLDATKGPFGAWITWKATDLLSTNYCNDKRDETYHQFVKFAELAQL